MVLFSENDQGESVFNSAYIYIEETRLRYLEKHGSRIRADTSLMGDIGKMESGDSFLTG